MRRYSAVVAALVAVSTIVVAGIMHAPASAAAPATVAGSLAVSPTPAIASESVTAAGSFPTDVARPVMLHQKVGSSWARVAVGTTSGSGAFSFPFTAPSTIGTATTLRAYAPAVTVDGTEYPPLLTPNTTFTTVAQTGGLQWAIQGSNGYSKSDAWVATDQNITLKASFTPFRPGRRVVFQHRVGGVWTTFASGTENVFGVAFKAREFPLGEHTVRALAVAANGAPGRTTNNLGVATYERGSVSLVADGFIPDQRYSVKQTTVPGPDSSTYHNRAVVHDGDTATTMEVPLPEGMTDTLSASVTDAGEVVYVAAACTWEWVWDDNGGQGHWELRCGSYGIYSWSWSGAPTLLRPGFSARVSPDGDSLIYAVTGPAVNPSPLLMLDRATDATSQITPDGYAWRSYRASSDFGRVVVDTLDATRPMYLWDRGSETRTVIGNGSFASISGDGSRVTSLTFDVDVAAYDADLQTTTVFGPSLPGNEGPRVSPYRPLLDADGDHVAWSHPGTGGRIFADAAILDVASGRSMQVSVTSSGVGANAYSRVVGISADGNSVYFETKATNLDPADTTNDLDLYVWQRP